MSDLFRTQRSFCSVVLIFVIVLHQTLVEGLKLPTDWRDAKQLPLELPTTTADTITAILLPNSLTAEKPAAIAIKKDKTSTIIEPTDSLSIQFLRKTEFGKIGGLIENINNKHLERMQLFQNAFKTNTTKAPDTNSSTYTIIKILKFPCGVSRKCLFNNPFTTVTLATIATQTVNTTTTTPPLTTTTTTATPPQSRSLPHKLADLFYKILLNEINTV